MRPAYNIVVNGTNITELVRDRLVSLTITDEAGVKSDRVELTLDDRDGRLTIPPTKAEMSVSIGYEGAGLVNKGIFTVEEVELSGPLRQMTIRANAIGASKGAGAAKDRSWHDTTLGEIARSIAGDRGWQVVISEALASVAIEHVDQSENDLQFLSRIAADNGGVVKVAHGKLVFTEHASGKTASGKEMQRVTVNASDVLDWSMVIAERGDYAGVKADYYDPTKGERGEAIAGEKGDNTHMLPHTFPNKEAADRAVTSKLESLKRGKEQFSIRDMVGNPLLESEVTLVAVGFRPGVDGEWSVIRVQHNLSESGYTCSIDSETPTAGKSSKGGKSFTTDQYGNRVLL